MPSEPVKGTPLFQVSRDDLEILERNIPWICQIAAVELAKSKAESNTKIRQIQQALVNIRWNGMPYSEIHIIPVDGEPP